MTLPFSLSGLLAISLALTGCSSAVVLSGDDPVPINRTVVFYLKDGTCIRSEAERHETTGGGYLVRGERWKAGKRLGSFSNVLQDHEIQKIAVYEFDSSRTWIAVGVTVGTLAFLISYLWWGPGAPYM